MYKVRVGNDINIQWRIFRNDSPEDFAGKTLRLLMRGTSQTIEVRDYVLEGNVIKWEYKGKDQRGPSTFTFTLIENEGKDDMFTVDKCDVLRLVSCSCQADDDDGRFDMFIDTDIVLPSNGVDGKTPVLESGETQTLEPGSEATADVVRNGEDESGNPKYKVNLGIPTGEPFTYDDFTPEQIEGLKKPALDAAAVAAAAADAATKAAANADNAAKTATDAASSANDAADRAGQAAVDAGLAKTAAEEAAERATEAAEAAGSAAEEANAAAEAASQTNTEVSTAEQARVTAEEQRAVAEQTRQTEFSQLKQEAQTATQEANAAAAAANQAVESIEESLSVKQDKTDESLQTTDKTVTGAINENLASIRKLDKAAGQPTIEEIDLTSDIETGYFWVTGGGKTYSAGFSVKYVNLNKGDLLIINAMSIEDIAQLTVVDNTHTKAVQLIDSEGKSNTYIKSSFLADKDCIVAISRHGTTSIGEAYAYIVKSAQNTAFADAAGSTAALHKIYESYGAVYNKDTGYWELNGLTDLTEEEMYDIYLWTRNIINQPDLASAFRVAPIRTTFAYPFRASYKASVGTSLNQAFLSCSQLEVACLLPSADDQIQLNTSPTACHNAFGSCPKLREIKNVLYVIQNAQNIFSSTFSRCLQLSKVRIKGLRQNLSFKDSPLLSYESLNYLVTNAANTSAITVTVHPTTYSYLTGTAEPTAEVGGTSEE